MLVVVRLGATLEASEKRTAKPFATPTLAHFGTVFFIAMLALVPDG